MTSPKAGPGKRVAVNSGLIALSDNTRTTAPAT